MRKLLVVLGIAFLLVAGCEAKSYTVVITNLSATSGGVEYTYNNSTGTLAKDASKTYYDVKPYTQPPVIIEPNQSEPDPTKKKTVLIQYDTTTGDYTFVDP